MWDPKHDDDKKKKVVVVDAHTIAPCGYDRSRGAKIPRAGDEGAAGARTGKTLAKGNVGIGGAFRTKVPTSMRERAGKRGRTNRSR